MATIESKDAAAAEIEDVQKFQEHSHPDQLAQFDQKRAARIRHRIDWRLLPALSIMYAICLIDRNNMSGLAVAGMTVELDIVGGFEYNLINMAFFITYIILQPFMIVVARKIGPRWFLPVCVFLWGCLTIGAGFSPNWQTLLGVRLILGVLESGFFPSCVYILSAWYTRFESAKRYSAFYLTGSCMAALASVVGYGLSLMNGIENLSGWRWMLIMVGVFTVGAGMFGAIMMVKFPDEELKTPSVKFLSRDELDFATARLHADRADVELEPFTLKRFLEPATDWYIYGFPALLMLNTALGYAFAFTLPVVLRESLGFGVAKALCLTTPPYFCSAIVMFGSAWLSDKYQTRGPVLIVLTTISLIGLPIMGWAKNPWVKYFGVFVTISGANSAIPTVMAYQATNIRGQWRRAFCSATLTGLGGIGGIIGALIFRGQDAPHYYPGFIACIVASVLVIIIVLIMSAYFRRCNAQADRGERILLGDPNFRFTI